MLVIRLLALCVWLLASTATVAQAACAGGEAAPGDPHAMHADMMIGMATGMTGHHASDLGDPHEASHGDSRGTSHGADHDDCGTDCCGEACLCASACPSVAAVLPTDGAPAATMLARLRPLGEASSPGQPPGLDVPPPRSA